MKKKLYVIYKSHLDLGYTDYAENVRKLYLTQFFPTAIRNAIEVNRNGKKRFVWLTGSWILQEYLDSIDGEELELAEYAIRNDYISWHAMPFTVQAELLTPELLEHCLSISQKLDRKYGKQTIAAKQTDVPGVTKAMIKPLRKAGVSFLHIGVNTACKMPCVPSIFRWRNNDGEELITIYDGAYGVFTQISDTCAMIFCFGGDNTAPMSAEDIRNRFAEIEQRYPDYDVVAASISDVAREAEKVRDSYPIIEGEIGDSWAYGLASDPRKTLTYHALLRYAKTCGEAEREGIYNSLMTVPEHTWGMSQLQYLADYEHYSKDQLAELLEIDRIKKLVSSWEEQRAYVLAAIHEGNAALATEYKRERVSLPNANDALPHDLRINEYGEIVSLKLNGKTLADEDHPLCTFVYEQFSEKEYDRFFTRYTRYAQKGQEPEHWALTNLTKVGMRVGIDRYRRYRPTLEAVSCDGNTVAVDCVLPAEACEQYGCPRRVQYTLTFGPSDVEIDFAWFEKDKNRMAEAMWLVFSPLVASAADWRIEKLGQMLDPFHRVADGGVQHYTCGAVRNADLELSFPDGALITFGQPNLLDFDDSGLTGECISVNLYNNAWETNYPLWYGEDGRIRIRLTLS